MLLECLDEVRVTHDGAEYLFEERARFGYVYEVPDELGEKAVATGKCREILVDENHPYTGPTPEAPTYRKAV